MLTPESPSLLHKVIAAHKARSTHHKMALDALLLLRGREAVAWRNFFLAFSDAYLRGAKAPDDEFRDSKNQVLHVGDNYWGGAPETCALWQTRLVSALRSKAWSEAAFAAGCLSHYYMDPIQPLHTGQTEHEGAVHAPIERSIAKSYPVLREAIVDRQGGYPDVPVEVGAMGAASMVRQGAELAAPYYDAMIDHFDLEAAVKSPPEGLDPTLQDIVAKLIAHATAGYAGLLSAAIVEAGAHAPPVETSVRAYVEMLGIPAQWVANKLADAQDRAEVMAIYREFKATGKVIKALNADDRTIRALHAKEVLKAPLADLDASPARAPGGRYGQAFEASALGRAAPKSIAQEAAAVAARQAFDQQGEKVRLRINDPVVNAPAIGPKTAERLETIGVMTVADLMALDPTKAASDLATRHITAADVADWQAMAQLQMDVPALNAIDTQLLVALGVRDAAGLAGLDAADFAVRLAAFVRQADGQRLLRNAPRPDAARVAGWVAAARAG